MDGIGNDAYLTIPYIPGGIYHALQGMEAIVLKPVGFRKKCVNCSMQWPIIINRWQG